MNQDKSTRWVSQFRELLKPTAKDALEEADKNLPAPYGLAVQIGSDFVPLADVALTEYGDFILVARVSDGALKTGELVNKTRLRLQLKAIALPERETEETRRNCAPAFVL